MMDCSLCSFVIGCPEPLVSELEAGGDEEGGADVVEAASELVRGDWVCELFKLN